MTGSTEIASRGSEIAGPQTDTEKKLAAIWKDVIGVETIGVNDLFMDVGGNSLNLVEVIGQVKEKMGVSIKARLFFDKDRSTIAELSKKIDAIKAN